VVNDKQLYQNIRHFLGNIAPEKVDIVTLHNKNKPIFETHAVTRQIKSSFGKTATMNSGAYIIIESTEAMHVIDVNSGHKMSNLSQEDAVLHVNVEAAEEIARQMRLRDIGGLITIDFIDMRNNEHKKELFQVMREAMRKDRAQHTILPLSKFGLMQITRQRVRPEVKINTAEICPACNGTGKVTPTMLVTDDIERDLKFILQSGSKGKMTLKTHPFVEAYLKKGLPNLQMKWYARYYKWVNIKSENSYQVSEYKFFNDTDDEIRLN
jgi:ribonuclease G